MIFHVVSLPHTQTDGLFSSCAYTQKVIGFCKMMMALGHDVFLYAGDKNTTPCTEHIVCISEEERAAVVGTEHYTSADFDHSKPHWVKFNQTAAEEIKKRAKKTDFLCVIAGIAHKQIADTLPDLTCVEFGVGYGGTFSNFRVYESYAWMHASYGSSNPHNPNAIDGRWYDAVIPGYLNPDDFPFLAEKDDYYLYVGRLVDRKGYQIAIDMCRKANKRLIMAGPGTPPSGVEYAGVVGPEERGRLMAGAKALIAPTIYCEPFGNVAIEAQACGTPVISTDWGAFTETVVPGVTGYRCRTLPEFVAALSAVETLDPYAIRQRVIDTYSYDAVGLRYQDYFQRLEGLWNGGWYGERASSFVQGGGGVTYSGMSLAHSYGEPHLGGNIVEGDAYTHCPRVWDYVIDRFAVRSALDLGSGRGHAAHYMAQKGVSVIAVDGLRYNVVNALHPTVQHDLTNGPFQTDVDFVHCQEVAEHISEEHADDFVRSLASGRVVLLTHAVPGQGGHHHVNCQDADYWINMMALAGYRVLAEDTNRIRKIAAEEGAIYMARTGILFSRGTEKTYPDIKIGAHYICYKQKRAATEALKSFRKHYPVAPVRLVSDGGDDFSDLAEQFNCAYEHADQIGDGKTTAFQNYDQAKKWLDRLRVTCKMMQDADWIVLLEDDVRTQDRISRMPASPIAGPCTMPYSKPAVDYIRMLHPDLSVRGWSGCGGTIFNRRVFLECFAAPLDFEIAEKLDPRIVKNSDALLTWLFLVNGHENSQWEDHSERARNMGRLDAAFDHQYKKFYQ